MRQDRWVTDSILGNDSGSSVLRQLREKEIDPSDAERVLELLQGLEPLELVMVAAAGNQPERGAASDSSITSDIAEKGIDALVSRYGVNRETAAQALELLRNGTVQRDLASVSAETARAVGQIPAAVVGSVHAVTQRPLSVFGFSLAVARDIAELPREGVGLGESEFRRLMAGGKGSPGRDYPLFDHTFRALYEVEAIEVLRDWVVSVTAYQSVQVAIKAYAETHGIKLTDDDIAAARDAIQQGNLTPLVLQGVDYFRREYSDEFPDVLQSLG